MKCVCGYDDSFKGNKRFGVYSMDGICYRGRDAHYQGHHEKDKFTHTLYFYICPKCATVRMGETDDEEKEKNTRIVSKDCDDVI